MYKYNYSNVSILTYFKNKILKYDNVKFFTKFRKSISFNKNIFAR